MPPFLLSPVLCPDIHRGIHLAINSQFNPQLPPGFGSWSPTMRHQLLCNKLHRLLAEFMGRVGRWWEQGWGVALSSRHLLIAPFTVEMSFFFFFSPVVALFQSGANKASESLMEAHTVLNERWMHMTSACVLELTSFAYIKREATQLVFADWGNCSTSAIWGWFFTLFFPAPFFLCFGGLGQPL